ncbi:hypothetical protein BS78_10G243200 [Paspalum vaginatum]|nr:hypothetical protein BS78_10G243200 [Paspalum vaginatum]
MSLRSPSRTRRRVADSPPPTSQGGSSNGAKAAAARKIEEEVEHLLAKLEKEGVEINDKIASIIDKEEARIEAEVVRKNENNELKRTGIMCVLSFASAAVGCLLGMERCERSFYQAVAMKIVFGE